MAEPDYFRMLEIPSPEEERTRSIISRPSTAGGYQGYYQDIASRRGPSTAFAGPQRRLSVKDWQSAQGRAAYEQEARRAVQQLASIEPDDPELPYKQEDTLMRSRFGRELVKDPRVVSVLKNRTAENLRLQKQFQDDPDSQTDYLIARREGADPRTALGRAMQASELRKNRLWFAEKGGDLEAFDSGQFMREGRFDRAAAQAYVNKLPPKKKAEDAKPWQERLSYKEGEAIREAARAAKAGTFQDFETEFTEQTTKKDAPFKGTRDEYVKQFKGDPNFDAYRQRRLMETGQNLMDEYGLSQEEAAQVLGIRGKAGDRAEMAPSLERQAESRLNAVKGLLQQGVTDPRQVLNYLNFKQDGTKVGDFTPDEVQSLIQQANPGNLDSSRPVRGPEAMFAGVKPTSLAQVEGAPATAAPISPADLKKIEPGQPEPVTFESLAAQVAAKPEAEKRKREEEFLSRQKAKEATQAVDNQLWEGAKSKLLQGLTPEMTAVLSPSPNEAQFTEIFQRAGIDPSKPAFTYPAQNGIPGREVSWYEVLTQGLAQDPRIKKIQEGQQAAPARKSFAHLF